jgi:hypothetical protein
MLVTVTIPGATTFWLSSPPCDDPTKIAKRNRLQNVHHQTKQKSHCEIFGTLAKQHFEKKKKKKTENCKKDFRILTVLGWNF